MEMQDSQRGQKLKLRYEPLALSSVGMVPRETATPKTDMISETLEGLTSIKLVQSLPPEASRYCSSFCRVAMMLSLMLTDELS